MGYTQAFKVTVIERSLKKSSRDPAFLTNYRPISNLSFISKILERVVVKQLTDYLQRTGYVQFLDCSFLFSQFHLEIVKTRDDIIGTQLETSRNL